MDALVTDAEIEASTGAVPWAGRGGTWPDGSEVDLGRRVIRESRLSNGDKS